MIDESRRQKRQANDTWQIDDKVRYIQKIQFVTNTQFITNGSTSESHRQELVNKWNNPLHQRTATTHCTNTLQPRTATTRCNTGYAGTGGEGARTHVAVWWSVSWCSSVAVNWIRVRRRVCVLQWITACCSKTEESARLHECAEVHCNKTEQNARLHKRVAARFGLLHKMEQGARLHECVAVCRSVLQCIAVCAKWV